MPNCPDCGEELGVFEMGTICPVCMRLFSYIETAGLPGYDREFMEATYRVYKIMYAARLLGPGENRVHFGDDAMIIERDIDPS